MDDLNHSNIPADRSSTILPRGRRLILVVLSTCAVAITLFVASLYVGSGHRATTVSPVNGGPALVTKDQLARVAASAGQPVYWVGPRGGYSYELTRISNGRIYVRYLPRGVKAGDRRPDFLVVGTYEVPNAYAVLRSAAKQPESVSETIPGGGLLVYNARHPTSVYFSFPRARYQVEVYAPSPQTARSIVAAGNAIPVR